MKRPKITVVNWYDVFPFNHGGSLAIRGLYKALSEWYDITIAMFSERDIFREEIPLSEHLTVVPITVPQSVLALEERFFLESGFSEIAWKDNALVASRYYPESPELVDAVRRIAGDSEIVITEHPYTFRLIENSCPGKTLWYRAQNIEYEYKKATWKSLKNPEPLHQEVFDLEKQCCDRANLILTIAQTDADGFQKLYGVPKSKILNISAGYDTGAIDYLPPSERKSLNGKYRLSTLFISSNAVVAVEAGNRIVSMARETPDIFYTIAGSVGSQIKCDPVPVNVNITGIVSEEEKIRLLKTSDVALNLIEGGSGLNMKMLEYFAYGLPVITTKFGARGLDITGGVEAIITEGDEYKRDILSFAAMSLSRRDALAGNALALLKRKYSWRSVAIKIIDHIKKSDPSKFEKLMDAATNDIELIKYPSPKSYLPEVGQMFYIWGAGEFGRNCLRVVKNAGRTPTGFVDMNPEKWGTEIGGVKVFPPKRFFDNPEKSIVIVAMARHFPLLVNLLRKNINPANIAIAFNGIDIFRCDNTGALPYYISYEKLLKAARTGTGIPDIDWDAGAAVQQ